MQCAVQYLLFLWGNSKYIRVLSIIKYIKDELTILLYYIFELTIFRLRSRNLVTAVFEILPF